MAQVSVIETVALEIRLLGCGHYAVLPPDRWTRLMQTGEQLWCPYGLAVSYTETENARLRKQLGTAQEVANSARQAEKTTLLMLEAEQRAKQRLLRRVKAGVCPHCHRTFQQVARHMASKHPEQK